MQILTRPGFVINRGGEKLEANSKGFITTENKEIIEVLQNLFPIKQEIKGKSEAKK